MQPVFRLGFGIGISPAALALEVYLPPLRVSSGYFSQWHFSFGSLN
ncbi:hypothetical protein COO91_09419 (plasmid) [Nostoc flagelliforme CCNUN1]|uniref:Uncharacterized protein n=1 Tax=Nostoc flagelliforme CCNUN1 TaxID=2038116 RepID=A0A2K8T6B2_9NOSO|nr:hypothetical protein COO91_09419 [Nostoc flagelliforme CCNUN1]